MLQCTAQYHIDCCFVCLRYAYQPGDNAVHLGVVFSIGNCFTNSAIVPFIPFGHFLHQVQTAAFRLQLAGNEAHFLHVVRQTLTLFRKGFFKLFHIFFQGFQLVLSVLFLLTCFRMGSAQLSYILFQLADTAQHFLKAVAHLYKHRLLPSFNTFNICQLVNSLQQTLLMLIQFFFCYISIPDELF